MSFTNIKTTIAAERDLARKDGFTNTLRVTQAMLTAIAEAETSGKTRKDLDDTQTIAVLRELADGYRKAASAMREGGRIERAIAEERDAEIVESFLPRMLDEEATRTLVADLVVEAGLKPPFEPKMNGIIMRQIKTRDDVDPKLAASMIKPSIEANI